MIKERRKCGIEIEYTGHIKDYSQRDPWHHCIQEWSKTANMSLISNFNMKKGLFGDNDLHLTYDGSVTPPGIEIQTRPFLLQDKTFIDKLFSLLIHIRSKGGCVDNSCGLHVHISAYDFTSDNIKNLILFYYKYQSMFYSFVTPYRVTGSHSYPLTFPVETIKEMRKTNSILELQEIYQNYTSKYNILNADPLVKHRHYEVRAAPGTLNPARILNWVLLHMHVAQYIKQLQKVINIKEYMPETTTLRNTGEFFSILDFGEGKGYFTGEQKKYKDGAIKLFNSVKDKTKIKKRDSEGV